MICKEIAEQYGADSKYLKDCQIRAVTGLPYADAAALLNWSLPPPIVIHAGTGTLVKSENSEEFTPAPTLGRMAAGILMTLADLTPATPEEIANRLVTCHGCDLYKDGKCRACGCFTQAKALLKAQKCPTGKW